MSVESALPAEGEKVSFRTGIGKFARQLEDFSSNLRIWRDALGDDYEQRWQELQDDPRASLSRTLDRLLLSVLERQLEFIRALRGAILEEVYDVSDDDPFGLPEQAIRFRAKADTKILYLEDQVKRVANRLGLQPSEPDEDIFSLPEGNLPAEAEEPAAVRSTSPISIAKPKSLGVSTDALERRVDSIRRIYRHESDLQIRSKDGVETMSLQYYLVSNSAGGPVAMLDLERFVSCHRIALSGAIRMLRELDGNGARAKAILKRVQAFLKSLYASVRTEIAESNLRILPYTGNSIDQNVLFNFEAMVNMREWLSTDDIQEFRELFYARMDWPLTELLGKPEERRKYLESIAMAAEQ